MQIDNPKILSVVAMRAERDRLVADGKTLVFTNGCFDILHRGHVTYLTFARNQGDALVVGLNTDASVRANKGDDRPINSEDDRAFVLGSLRAVDYVVLFGDGLGALCERTRGGGESWRARGAGGHGGRPLDDQHH